MWQFFLILYFVFGATSYLQRRVLAKQFNHYNWLINAVFFVFFLLPAALLIGFLSPHDLNIGIENYILLLVGSLIWPVFGLVSFRANKDVDVGIYVIITNISPIFTLMVAVPLMGERLSGIQWLGAALLIVSGVLAGLSQLRKHSRANLRGIVFCFIATILLGFAIAYERYMLNRIDFGTYVLIGWGSQIVWMAGLAYKEWPKLPQLLNDAGLKNIASYSLMSTLKSVTFILALLLSGSASIIGAAGNFMAVVVVIAAYIFLKENKHMFEKITSVAIGIAGLIMLTL